MLSNFSGTVTKLRKEDEIRNAQKAKEQAELNAAKKAAEEAGMFSCPVSFFLSVVSISFS